MLMLHEPGTRTRTVGQLFLLPFQVTDALFQTLNVLQDLLTDHHVVLSTRGDDTATATGLTAAPASHAVGSRVSRAAGADVSVVTIDHGRWLTSAAAAADASNNAFASRVASKAAGSHVHGLVHEDAQLSQFKVLADQFKLLVFKQMQLLGVSSDLMPHDFGHVIAKVLPLSRQSFGAIPLVIQVHGQVTKLVVVGR